MADAIDSDDGEPGIPLGLVTSALNADGGALDRAADEVASAIVRRFGTPADVDAERALLAALVRDPSQVPLALYVGVTRADFAHGPHAVLFEAVTALHAASISVDEVTLRARLDAAQQLVPCGRDLGVVCDLAHRMFSVAGVQSHARIVKQKAALRAVISTVEGIAATALRQGHDVADIVRSAESDLARLRGRLTETQDPIQEAIELAKRDIAAQAGPSKKWTRLLGKSAADLAKKPRMGIDWLARGLLAKRAVATIGAQSKGTKTWVGTELMIALSTGTPVFGKFHVPDSGWSLAIYIEDGESNLQSRMLALTAGRRMDPEKALAKIRYDERVSIDLMNDEDCAGIVASARAMPEPPTLIYIDPLRDAHKGEENSSDDMSRVMHRLQVLRNLTGAAIVVPHHMGRPSKERAGQRLSDRLRGSTAIHGALDGGIYIETKADVRTPHSRRWDTIVDVDVRDGSPTAGMFGLSLDVQLEDGSARMAGWAFHEDVNAFDVKKKLKSDIDVSDPKSVLRARIINALRVSWEQAEATGVDASCGADAIAIFTKSSTATVKRRLDELTHEKPARVGRAGRGWVYLPEESEDDT